MHLSEGYNLALIPSTERISVSKYKYHYFFKLLTPVCTANSSPNHAYNANRKLARRSSIAQSLPFSQILQADASILAPIDLLEPAPVAHMPCKNLRSPRTSDENDMTAALSFNDDVHRRRQMLFRPAPLFTAAKSIGPGPQRVPIKASRALASRPVAVYSPNCVQPLLSNLSLTRTCNSPGDSDEDATETTSASLKIPAKVRNLEPCKVMPTACGTSAMEDSATGQRLAEQRVRTAFLLEQGRQRIEVL